MSPLRLILTFYKSSFDIFVLQNLTVKVLEQSASDICSKKKSGAAKNKAAPESLIFWAPLFREMGFHPEYPCHLCEGALAALINNRCCCPVLLLVLQPPGEPGG